MPPTASPGPPTFPHATAKSSAYSGLLFRCYSDPDHRGIKQRYSPLRGFGSVVSAGRFCRAYEEQHQYFRARSRPHERVSLAAQRHRFRDRWAAVLTELTAA